MPFDFIDPDLTVCGLLNLSGVFAMNVIRI